MAGILKHRYTNPHADVGGSTKTQASHWNDFLMATGGLHGDALTRDTSDATYGMKWTSGAVAGVWQDVPYNAANFSGNLGMIWTVEPGDVTTYAYTVLGKTMCLIFNLGSTTVGGTVSTALMLRIPGGNVAKYTYFTPCMYNEGASGNTINMVGTVANDNNLYIYKLGAAWLAGTNTTSLYGSMTFAIL